MNRKDFLLGATAFGMMGCKSEKIFTGSEVDFDENLVVFLSDLHVLNRDCYQYNYFARQVAEILRMDPLPRQVVVFGDIAYQCGLVDEYKSSEPFFRQMIAAGIKVTFGMGNHDRRSTFLEVWPEYVQRILVTGRIVSGADLGFSDFLMLDGLQGSDDRSVDDMGPVPGAFDEEQQEWIADRLSKLMRPTIIASHFPLADLSVCGRPFARLLADSQKVVGYIHGHDHRWKRDWVSRGWDRCDCFRTLCLPSTGHWGDIGYTTFRIGPGVAKATFMQKDFFFPSPSLTHDEFWEDVREEHRDMSCTFRWRE